MIAIDDNTRPVPPDICDAPGGFAWWYAEIITPDGTGDRANALA
jgi:hypothetical protein